jgi:23S rRNA pseudouridine1911/1915/1917 synthase
MFKFEVSQESSGQRLDLFLTLIAGQFSRSRIKQFLDKGAVKVNSEVEYRPNYKVAVGDMIELEVAEEVEKKELPGYDIPIKIIYADEDIILVDKPSGLKVHPTAVDDNKSLLNAIYFHLGDKLTNYGANLINRIDKDTSGLVAVAISPKGAWHYSRQFAESKVRKEYLAVVDGKWISYHGFKDVHVGGFLKYDQVNEKQFIHPSEGEFADTTFKLIKTSDDKQLALLSAIPTTGRTHQIRVHLESLNFPILGDTKYSGEPASRLMLHAYKLQMTKLGGGEIKAVSEMPAEFQI